MLALAVSERDHLVIGGTELVSSEAHILFWSVPFLKHTCPADMVQGHQKYQDPGVHPHLHPLRRYHPPLPASDDIHLSRAILVETLGFEIAAEQLDGRLGRAERYKRGGRE